MVLTLIHVCFIVFNILFVRNFIYDPKKTVLKILNIYFIHTEKNLLCWTWGWSGGGVTSYIQAHQDLTLVSVDFQIYECVVNCSLQCINGWIYIDRSIIFLQDTASLLQRQITRESLCFNITKNIMQNWYTISLG